MNVLFAPDFRPGNPYQALLATALEQEKVRVTFPAGHRRLLPLFRQASTHASDLLHLHWPEGYFARRGDAFDPLRRLRYPLDLRLAARIRPLVYTAHNLLPHDGASWVDHRIVRATLRESRRIIVHSTAAANVIHEYAPAVRDRTIVIPHGDLAATFPPLPPRDEARAKLGVSISEPLVLIFGRAEPYKNIEPVIAAWPTLHRTARLWIAGMPLTPEYGHHLAQCAQDRTRVTLELDWLDDPALALRLAAADAVLFNYRRIFTSGAACLVRSLGIPLLIPRHCSTVELAEPSPLVMRFESIASDIGPSLERALKTRRDETSVRRWRESTAWASVAELTARAYREALNLPCAA